MKNSVINPDLDQFIDLPSYLKLQDKCAQSQHDLQAAIEEINDLNLRIATLYDVVRMMMKEQPHGQ